MDSQSELCPWDIAVTVPVNLVAIASEELTDQVREGEGREARRRRGERCMCVCMCAWEHMRACVRGSTCARACVCVCVRVRECVSPHLWV